VSKNIYKYAFMGATAKAANMRNGIALVFVLFVIVMCLAIARPENTFAETAKPSIPEFTLSIEDHSYEIQPTYSTDPYTGNSVKMSDGYHVEKRFVEVKIKNQAPFTPYTIENKGVTKLYYNIRAKGHFEEWTGNEPNSQSNLAPSNSEYTTVEFGFGKDNPGGFNIWLGEIAPGGQVDFQIEVIEGYYTTLTTQDACWRLSEYNVFTETGRSGWSDSQTITVDPIVPTISPVASPSASIIPSTSFSVSQSPASSQSPMASASPSTPFAVSKITLIVVVAVVFVAILAAVLLAYLRKIK
jgi:hypothetical protein